MSALATAARRTFFSVPRLTVRERDANNQMTMFMVISIAALAFMMLLPSPRAAFAAVEPAGTVAVQTTDTTGRLPIPSDTDRACAGETWGAESLDCILAIAKDSGQTRVIRLADAGIRN